MAIDNTTPGRAYPLPASPNWLSEDVVRLITALMAVDTDVVALLSSVSGKAATVHLHEIGDVNGLIAALGALAPSGHQHTLASLSDVNAPAAANKKVLRYNSATSKWEPSAISADDMTAGTIPVDRLPDAYLRHDVTQTLDAAAKARVRSNAAAVGYEAQTLSAAQQGLVRANIGAEVLGGFRNKIINGNFPFWQRGTSFSANGYTADRWHVDGGGGTFNVSPYEYARGVNYCRIWRSVNGASPLKISQKIEDIVETAGKLVTVTFDAVKTGAAIVGNVYLIQDFGAGGSAIVTTAAQTFTPTSPGTRYRLKFQVGSLSFKTFGTNPNLTLVIEFPATETFTAGASVYLSRVSLVIGDATAEADPFSPRHLQQELALCQRYYEIVTVYALSTAASGTIVQRALGCFKVTKRVSTPAILSSVVSGALTAPGVVDFDENIASVGFASTGAGLEGKFALRVDAEFS